MSCWLENYEVKGVAFLCWPVISPYSIRHFAALGDNISGWKKAAHFIVAMLEAVPVLGQAASGCEWLAHYFFDRKVIIDHSEKSKGDSDVALPILRGETAKPELQRYEANLRIEKGAHNGLVGDVEKCRNTLYKFTLENGDPLPLESEDVLIAVNLIKIKDDIPEPLKKGLLGRTLYLPGILFDGKDTGDQITLKFQDYLITFILDNCGKFSFKYFYTEIQKYCYSEDGKTLFSNCGRMNGPEAYKKLKSAGKRDLPEIEIRPPELFSFNHEFKEVPLVRDYFQGTPGKLKCKIYHTDCDLEIQIALSGFDPKGFNFVLDQELLTIRYKYDTLEKYPDLIPCTEEDAAIALKQYQVSFHWKEFFGDIGIEQAKAKLQQAGLSYKDGYAYINMRR